MLRRGVFANVTLNILGQLGEVVVGELVLRGHQHLVVQLVAEHGRTRQEEKELHVVLSAAVDDGVVIVVSVNDVVVGLCWVGFTHEGNEALAIALISWALRVSDEVNRGISEGNLVGVVYLESTVDGVQISVDGLGADVAVGRESLIC